MPPASDLPAEGLQLPVYVPPPSAAPPPVEQAAAEEHAAEGDTILYSGYLPGYRRGLSLGGGPYDPPVAGLPGLMTGGYGAAVPPNEWTFAFHGSMSATAQLSFDQRPHPTAGQSSVVTHVTPQTIDTWQYFTSTMAVPGSWADLRFSYGTSKVSANFALQTYNPTAPTSYYQLGSQWFIQNAFLDYNTSKVGPFSFRFRAGRFSLTYGQLGRYGGGMYSNPMMATLQGVGLQTLADAPLGGEWEFVLEHNLLTSRDGTIPWNVIRQQNNGWRRPLWVGSAIHGVHVGLNYVGRSRLELRARHLVEFASDDRLQLPLDDTSTRQVDESHIKDASLQVMGVDARLLDDSIGTLGAAASYTVANNAYPLRAMITYGGYGEDLTDRFLGMPSGGSGTLFVAGVNYEASLRRAFSPRGSFDGRGQDLAINTGFYFTRTGTIYEPFEGRVRYKMGTDLVYTMFQYMGVGVRVDRVVPDAADSGQTFHVISPRLLFKTDYGSRETLQILYTKWFFGNRTRNEGTGERSPERLDDQFFALNMNMWW